MTGKTGERFSCISGAYFSGTLGTFAPLERGVVANK